MARSDRSEVHQPFASLGMVPFYAADCHVC
jgi:hypothetical protein